MGILSMARRNPKDLLGFIIAALLGLFAARFAPTHDSAQYIYILVSYHAFLAWVVLLSDEESGLSMPIGATIATHLACVFLVVCVTLARRHIPFFGILRIGMIAIAGFERNWMFTVSPRRPAEQDTGPVDLLKPQPTAGLAQYTSAAALPVPKPQADVIAAPTVTQPNYQPIANPVPPQAPTPAVVPAVPVIAQSKRAVSDPGSKTVLMEDTSIADSIRRKPAQDEADAAPIMNATAQDHEDWLRERARQNPTHRKPGMSVKEEYEHWLMARFKARASQETKGARAAAR